MQRTVLAAVVVVGITATAVAGWFSYRSYRHVEIQQTAFKTDNAASAVKLALDRVALAVRAVRAMYAADRVTREQFERFARTLTTSEGIRSLGFYRRVPLASRQAYEMGLSTEPGKTLGIWQYDENGKPVRAPDRPVYYPVDSAYVIGGPEPSYGLDVASLPGRVDAIDKAISSFDLVIGKPILFTGSTQGGVVFYVPATDRTGAVVGVATGTLTFDELSTVAAQTSGAAGVKISVDVDEPSDASAPGAAAEPATPNKRVFNFGDRTWTVTVPPAEGENSTAAWLVVLVVGAGLATTVAVVAYLIGLSQTADATEARAQLRGMLDGLGPLAWLLTPDGEVMHVNRTASTALGRAESEIVGQPFWNLPLGPESAGEVERIRAAIKRAANGEDVRFDLTLTGSEGDESVFDLWIRPLGPRPAAHLVASAADITDRHEGEQTQRLLMRELDHRMKNTLQVIQAVIRRTARTQGSIETFERSLLGRVGAMSRAHDLLAQERWLGAEMGTVIDQEVKSFDPGGAIRASGPSIRLNPRAALSVALAIHELGTNAAKYGALASSGGTISLTWSIDRSGDQPMVVLRWQESGGPEVSIPENKGFGSMLIERSIAYELEGHAVLDYRREGLVCEIFVPFRMLRPFVAERVVEAAG